MRKDRQVSKYKRGIGPSDESFSGCKKNIGEYTIDHSKTKHGSDWVIRNMENDKLSRVRINEQA